METPLRVVFLGDETSAAGYRLAGVEARSVDRGEEDAALKGARASATLVLVAASIAAQVSAQQWRAAVASITPLVVVVPDLAGGPPFPDLALKLKRQLGLVEDGA